MYKKKKNLSFQKLGNALVYFVYKLCKKTDKNFQIGNFVKVVPSYITVDWISY